MSSFEEDKVGYVRLKSVDNLNGRLLTIIDAMFVDKEQREAFKTIVRETTWKWFWDYVPSNIEMGNHLDDLKQSSAISK